ncbi:uncharacterized protein LOC143738851 [Siphateles boraxobius]|uniref:uncharacterized protein LOC143738851 n=1 Tax=Siphateles boraxobius TaxID=180520 RepID=UPI004062873F
MRGLLLLLSALLLLETTDGNEEYNQLSQHDKAIIDKAIKLANENHGKTKHLDFASVLNKNYDKRMLHVILRSTSCDKTTQNIHRKDCKIQDKARPQVSCVDCDGKMSCFLLRETEKIEQALSECLPSRSHLTGAGHSLARKAENEKQTGCLGCI